ncbi:PREDICTED: formin-like protein 5, partial [Chinchilla lanigera]|uniref:formin-like protein 5 n=1 Tax=Chinchilla lanigera TaxID=34839 RepID=UPI00069695F6
PPLPPPPGARALPRPAPVPPPLRSSALPFPPGVPPSGSALLRAFVPAFPARTAGPYAHGRGRADPAVARAGVQRGPQRLEASRGQWRCAVTSLPLAVDTVDSPWSPAMACSQHEAEMGDSDPKTTSPLLLPAPGPGLSLR